MNLSETARTVYQNRYHVDDETPELMLSRVARTLAGAEMNAGWIRTKDEYDAVYNRFYNVMDQQEALPNSPTLFNAGRDSGQLSACFVLPIEDSLHSIYQTLHDAVIIQHTGGGVGYSFSKLRPGGSSVMSSRGIAGGPVCFLRIYDAALGPIKQGGRRPGANMATLSVSHPDIYDFITCKKVEGEITNFNISVEIDEAFIQAVKNDTPWLLINPKDGSVVHQVMARDILQAIAQNAWQNGEPGVIFLERMNASNPTPTAAYPSVNPCGEQPLPPYEACNLGSINLYKHIDSEGINWIKLRDTVHTMVRMLDDVVECSKFPVEAVAHNVRRHRRIGLGVMGWADALIALEIPYCSDDALQLGKAVMKFIHSHARLASERLADSRGNFPGWHQSIFANQNRLMRNATVTTIAPTGSISILADCSSGIEPVYAFEYERFVMTPNGNVPFTVRHPLYAQAVESMERVGILNHKPNQTIFINAEQVPWHWHLKHQQAFQIDCDNGVSKTINMPHDSSVDDIMNAIIAAYDLGLKGFTVYRTGSRQLQLLDARKKCPVCEKKSVVEQGGCDTCTTDGCGWSACGTTKIESNGLDAGVQTDHSVAEK